MNERTFTLAFAATLVAGLGLAATSGACGSEEVKIEPGPAAGMGGTPAGGGAAGDGGESAGGGGGEGGSEPDCPHEGPPLLDPSGLDPCEPACGGAHCVPAVLVPPDQQSQLAPCTTGSSEGFCTPDFFIETGGNFIPPTCVSVAGAEGRCLSECLPQVADQAVVLPRSSCAEGEKCVPCFDPQTQEETGACNVSCDPGAMEPAVMIECPWEGPPVIDPAGLPDCDPACAGAHCLPAAYVPVDQQALLATCPGGFCTPDPLIAGGGESVPASCASVAGAEGRCLSACLPDIAAQPLLPQSTCASGERCAPCYDPTAADPTLATGACELACDAAIDAPVILDCPWTGPPVIEASTLPACSPACGGAHCLPAANVPLDLQPQLATCAGGFCVPDPLIETAGNYAPPSCTPFPGTPAEGRCLSDCLPAVAAQLGSLQQDVCSAGEHCVPCYDPFTGDPTGACTISSCDQPTTPPYTFPTCCQFNGNDQGTCVPTAMIPADQQANLNQLTCPTDLLCVPNEYLPDPPIPVETCFTILGAGACVSECTSVPGIFTQGSCPGNHLCVPCLLAPSTPGC
jgi:hypothetical protein